MAKIFVPEGIEGLVATGQAARDENEALVKLDHFVVAEKGKPMRAEDFLAAVRKAHEEGNQ